MLLRTVCLALQVAGARPTPVLWAHSALGRLLTGSGARAKGF